MKKKSKWGKLAACLVKGRRVVRPGRLRHLITAGLIANAGAAELKLLPEQVTLDGMEARHGVLAVRMGDGFAGPVEKVILRSSDADVARVDAEGVVVPVKDGEVTITATAADGAVATAQVTVKGMAGAHEWSFRNDVMPVLTKATCNSGGCHGALAGKGGDRKSVV